MTFFRQQIPVLIFAAGLGVMTAGPALAETGCGPMATHDARGENKTKMMKQHHDRIHDALKLTADQEPAWKSFMASEQAPPDMTKPSPDDLAKLTTLERAELRLARTKAHQEQMTEHVAALKVFYATLTPDQKKTFDDFHLQSRTKMSGKPSLSSAAAKPK